MQWEDRAERSGLSQEGQRDQSLQALAFLPKSKGTLTEKEANLALVSQPHA